MNIIQLVHKVLGYKIPAHPIDERLPIEAIAGMCNVTPYGCITTQVWTANWCHGKNSFFFELKGDWHDVPPMEVIVLSADGEIQGNNFRPLTPDEQVQALEFVRNNWPEEGY